MIRCGHPRIFEYGYSFYSISSEELDSSDRISFKENALAVRLAGADEEAWKDFFAKIEKESKTGSGSAKESTERKKPKTMTADQHRAVIAKLRGL